MNKLILKVKHWDDETNSLIVSFASDVSAKSVDEYSALAYQPTMFDNPEDIDFVLKRIAQSGFSVCETRNKQEDFTKNAISKNVYQNLVGKTFEYTIEDLFPRAIQEISINEEPR